MSIYRKLMAGATCATFALVVALATGSSADAQQGAELPDNVKEFLERNQVRRWAGLIEAGGKIFNERSCARCHGEGGSGGQWGPDLTDDEWVQSSGELPEIVNTIFWGVRREDFVDPDRRFQMNPSGGIALEREDYESLAAYVWSLSNGTFLPQR